MAVVTFTTDFGLEDAYVGVLKGVVLSLAPDAVLVDITHAVSPQDVRGGGLALADAVPYFPAGSIHLAVVDPGVGASRAPIAVASAGSFFVGPDNGLMALAAPIPRRVFRIANPGFFRTPTSPTFHGRDVFAVTAGQLAAGRPIEEVGPPLEGMTELALPPNQPLTDHCEAEVLQVDHVGNLITSRSAAGPLSGRWEMLCEGRRFELQGGVTFSEVGRGALVLYAGSSGRAELAVRDGSAFSLTQARAGMLLRLRRLS
jgi:hypothetical protein